MPLIDHHTAPPLYLPGLLSKFTGRQVLLLISASSCTTSWPDKWYRNQIIIRQHHRILPLQKIKTPHSVSSFVCLFLLPDTVERNQVGAETDCSVRVILLPFYLRQDVHTATSWVTAPSAHHTVVSYSITSLGVPRQRYWILGVTGAALSSTRMVLRSRRSM